MALDAVFPTPSQPIQPHSAGVSADQPKLAGSGGVKTQTETAVTPTEESESVPDNELSEGNKEGRGRLVDIKV